MFTKIKISVKNPSLKFWPVGQFDWPETWSINVKNEKLFKFPTKLFLGSLKHVEYNKISEKKPSSKFRPVGPFKWPETWRKMLKMKNSSNFLQIYF